MFARFVGLFMFVGSLFGCVVVGMVNAAWVGVLIICDCCVVGLVVVIVIWLGLHFGLMRILC